MTARLTSAWGAFGLYALVALAMSWPLPTQIAGAPAGDMGDPLLNAWILAWGSEHVTAILGGDVGAFGRWWQANIFHPAPLTLAYSEHLAPLVVMGLPLWWVSGNVLLVYNVLYLLTSALSGLGMFLLVRELTGRPRAALVAGLFFAFVPYRLAQLPHLQVLSSQWMPFAIYAFRRYLERGRLRALAGATAALVAQQLSCGYYLLYFSPFVALYLIWELTARRRWADWRLLTALAVAASADVAITWPFLSPYLELRSLGFSPRPLEEIASYSADVRGYLTAHESNRLWGPWLSGFKRPENELFPGLLPVLMAATGLVALAMTRWQATSILAGRGIVRWAPVAFSALAMTGAVGVLVFLFSAGVNLRIAEIPVVRIRSLDRPLLLLSLGIVGLLASSRRARAWCRWGTDLRMAALLMLLTAVVLSFGPEPRSDLKPLRFIGPYLWLYEHVPGFDGLRVPARLAMVAYVFLGILAGYGLAVLDRRRRGGPAMVIVGLLFLAEATGVPLSVGRNASDEGAATPPASVEPAATAPEAYQFLKGLPAGTVIAEFPFGFTSWELRYVYYSAVHQHRLLNGYSGGFPDIYHRHVGALHRPTTRPDRAWAMLVAAGVTHVVVHREGFLRGEDVPVALWLESRGARRIVSFRGDEVYQLPR
jgi:hypothetical protein